MGYSGPLALSCNDTKLHPAYRTYWDPEKQVHMLLGGIEGPKAVAEELRAIMQTVSESDKATKVRGWTHLKSAFF